MYFNSGLATAQIHTDIITIQATQANLGKVQSGSRQPHPLCPTAHLSHLPLPLCQSMDFKSPFSALLLQQLLSLPSSEALPSLGRLSGRAYDLLAIVYKSPALHKHCICLVISGYPLLQMGPPSVHSSEQKSPDTTE